MKATLLELFLSNVPLHITRGRIEEVISHCTMYELRDEHPLSFNTPMLGINRAHFFERDQQALFNIFDVDKRDFAEVVRKSPHIDPKRVVTSDTYNLFVTWIAHNILRSALPEKIKIEGMLTLFKMLHYKFFTSLVNHSYQYKADPTVMEETINGLTAKSDIRKNETSTWKLLIEKRSHNVIDPHGIHYKTIFNYGPDEKITYIISDIQTRLRTSIVLINREYYANKEMDKRIGSYGIVGEIDGEKIIQSVSSSFDTMVTKIANSALNAGTFINHEMVQAAAKLSSGLREDMLRALLFKFSDMAVQQYRKRQGTKVDGHGEHTILVGYEILISEIIQKSYRSCIFRKVAMNNKIAILEHIQNTFKSSRISDKDIVVVKQSVEKFVDDNCNTTRQQTKTSLKLGFLTYLILLSFKYVG